MTLGVGLVGLGYWGPNLARAIESSQAGRLAAICDSNPEALERAARRHPTAGVSPSTERLLGDDDISAIVIATPAGTHYELARAALQAGKHVMVEKPLTQTVAQAEELIAIAAQRELVLMPAHLFLYNAAVRRVKEYINSGELGDTYYVYSQRLNLGQVRHDVNALWNFAPHDISILAYWLDARPKMLMAKGFSYIQPGTEDVVFMTLEYPGGIGAHVHISWLDPQKVRLMTVVGSKKMVVYDDTSPDAKIRLIDKGVTRKFRDQTRSGWSLGSYESFADFQLLLRAGDVLIPKLDFREPLQLEVDDFLLAIREQRKPLSDASAGLEVVRVLEAAQRSLEMNGTLVSV